MKNNKKPGNGNKQKKGRKGNNEREFKSYDRNDRGGYKASAQPRRPEPTSLYFKASEFLFLIGTLIVKQHGFKNLEVVRHIGNLMVLRTETTPEMIINVADTVRLDKDGSLQRIQGPYAYDDPTRQLLSLTTLPQGLVRFSDDGFELREDENAMVLVASGAQRYTNDIPKGLGSAIVFYKGTWDNPYITGIVVRKAFRKEMRVVKWLSSNLSHLKRRSNGMFENEQAAAAERWSKENWQSYTKFLAEQGAEAIRTKTKRYRKDREVEVNGLLFLVKPNGTIYNKTNSSMTPMDPLYLVETGRMSAIRAQLGC